MGGGSEGGGLQELDALLSMLSDPTRERGEGGGRVIEGRERERGREMIVLIYCTSRNYVCKPSGVYTVVVAISTLQQPDKNTIYGKTALSD